MYNSLWHVLLRVHSVQIQSASGFHFIFSVSPTLYNQTALLHVPPLIYRILFSISPVVSTWQLVVSTCLGKSSESADKSHYSEGLRIFCRSRQEMTEVAGTSSRALSSLALYLCWALHMKIVSVCRSDSLINVHIEPMHGVWDKCIMISPRHIYRITMQIIIKYCTNRFDCYILTLCIFSDM
jgi:hypothetical protein